jgi:Ca-activated chloride channel family protein
MRGKEIADADSGMRERIRGVQAGQEVLNRQVAASDERSLGEIGTSSQREVLMDALGGLRRGSASRGQELEVAKEFDDRLAATEPESSVRLGKGLSDTEVTAGGGVYQGPGGGRVVDARARADGVANYAWSGKATPQKPAAPASTLAPSDSAATVDKKLDQASEVAGSARSQKDASIVSVAGNVPSPGQVFFKQNADSGVRSEEAGQSIGGTIMPADASSVQVQVEPVEFNTALEDFADKAKAEQNGRTLGVVALNGSVADQGADGPPSSSHFKVVPVNPWVLTERDALSTFGLDVDTASYVLCQRYIRNGYLPPLGAVRMEEFINAFDYAYPQRNDQPFTVYAEGAPAPFAPTGQDVTLLKVAVKARTIGRDRRRAAHLVLVVDASASMGQADRLPLVQSAANQLVDRLSEADRVSLITCAGEERLHLEAVSARQKDVIRATIDAIQPAGPTNLLAGLKLGYQMARKNFVAGQTNQVVLCSDGVANVGQTEAEAMLQEVAEDRKQAITLTCVGVGYGAYNDAFLEALAGQGDGHYVFLDSSAQAQQTLVGQLAASLQNVAQDARIQVQFNPNRVRRYRLIGYENRDLEDQRFRDDTVEAGAVGSGQCSTALYELELAAREGGMGFQPMNHRQDADATKSRGRDARDTEEADLGTVLVRYRNVETGQMEEISRPLSDSLVRRRSVEEDPRFFLAAGAARLAEWLRQSEHAQHTALADVQRLLDQVSAALPLDRDVQNLAALAHQAEGLPRAPQAAPGPEVLQ